ncbi:MAG: SprT-like family protein [Candidatus Methanofastidiosum methylothiophilum]|uniref:SprT-like family protein n=1 Tax=Candidatus Methanofastidiosum methylothiophilum TaxID=1705564 RepID=A0A150J5R8_9EURY|nr:MAG: SprT-like family protein [Candidatus Methanofastidiosum methylthiophilus]
MFCQKSLKPILEFCPMDVKLNQLISTVSANLGLRYRTVSDYYSYKSIKNTARVKNGILYVKVSDKLKDAPDDILEAMAYVLLSKIKGNRISPRYKRIYNDYIHSIIINDTSNLARGVHKPNGNYFDLENIFDKVNEKYLSNEIPKPSLRWSNRRAYRIFGRYDRSKNEIVISRLLDEHRTPFYVIEYIMYHEMLHIKYGFTYKKGRRRIHTSPFKKEEEKFPYYKESIEYLKKISGRERKFLS